MTRHKHTWIQTEIEMLDEDENPIRNTQPHNPWKSTIIVRECGNILQGPDPECGATEEFIYVDERIRSS